MQRLGRVQASDQASIIEKTAVVRAVDRPMGTCFEIHAYMRGEAHGMERMSSVGVGPAEESRICCAKTVARPYPSVSRHSRSSKIRYCLDLCAFLVYGMRGKSW